MGNWSNNRRGCNSNGIRKLRLIKIKTTKMVHIKIWTSGFRSLRRTISRWTKFECPNFACGENSGQERLQCQTSDIPADEAVVICRKMKQICAEFDARLLLCSPHGIFSLFVYVFLHLDCEFVGWFLLINLKTFSTPAISWAKQKLNNWTTLSFLSL